MVKKNFSLNSYSLFFSSVNDGFDNMSCMRNALPDFKEMFILESPSQEVEYDEEEAFREINRELEQLSTNLSLILVKLRQSIWKVPRMLRK